MGKRSNFERAPRDYYPTPLTGAAPLFPFLRRDGITTFAEICGGGGHLKRHLESDGLRCTYFGDIATGRNALDLSVADLNGGMPITNPPTKQGSTCHLLCDLLRHFLALGVPAWWLIHHDFVSHALFRHRRDPSNEMGRRHQARRDGFLQLVSDGSQLSAHLHSDPSSRRVSDRARDHLRSLRAPVSAPAVDRQVLFGDVPTARRPADSLSVTSVTGREA